MFFARQEMARSLTADPHPNIPERTSTTAFIASPLRKMPPARTEHAKLSDEPISKTAGAKAPDPRTSRLLPKKSAQSSLGSAPDEKSPGEVASGGLQTEKDFR
jgi:hypothetical protein